ncbi:MAG: TonB-dependent receptor, partial [Terriglobia bacterium]
MYKPHVALSIRTRLLISLLSVLVSSGTLMQAQVTTASILGTVTDNSGAAIPNADIAVKDLERNQEKTTKANDQGGYRIDFLVPGNYRVSISAPNFKTHVQERISLNAGVPVTINAELSPGTVNESVVVTGETPLVETSNAEVGATVDSHDMVALPLVNRNAYTLLDLTPGVQTNSVGQSFGAPTQTVIINGGANNGSGSTNYYLDGAPNFNALNNGGGLLPNPDALQEFRVQTSNYGAAYGRFGSGIVNALVRSGTNEFHGTVFDFFRNPHLNARPWHSLPSDQKEPLHRNQFGATLGGPIIKNKTFFFASYSGLRQTDAALLTGAIVPTALERAGNFTQSPGARPKDPLTGTNFVCNGVKDVICPDRIDPTALALFKYVPASNTPVATNNGFAAGWTGYSPSPINQDDFIIKINHTLSQTQTLSGTYFLSSGNLSAIASTNPSAAIAPYSTLVQTYKQQNFIANYTWAVNPSMVNNVWASYTRMKNTRTDTPEQSLANFGSTFSPQGAPGLPNIGVTGYWNMRNANAGPAGTDAYALRDLVTLTRGSHTLQMGAEFSLDKAAKVAYLNNYGQITFTGVITGNALADYLLGIPATFLQDSPAYTRTAAFTYAGFFQDDYRVARRLTLNLGLRYDVQTPPVESHDHNVTFVAGQQSTRFPSAPLGIVFPGDAGIPRGITDTRFGHIAPRFGFAFDPTGSAKTSIRGGVGLFWGSVSEELWTQGGNTSPYALSYTFPNTSSVNGATLSNPYRGGTNPFVNGGTGLFPNGARLGGVSRNADWPRTLQVNFSIQRQLTADMSVVVAYVGAFSSNQALGIEQNYPSFNTNYAASLGIPSCGTSATIVPSTSNAQCRRPIQPVGSFGVVQSAFNTDYNGLQISFTRRLSHQFSATGYYAWQKTMSDVPVQGGTPAGGVEDVNNLALERSRTGNDYTHQATIAIIWHPALSGGSRIVKALVNGWEIAPLARLHTGGPFSVLNGVDANLDGSSGDRARLVGDPFTGPRTISQWFNTAAFA